ncbi:pectinesterase family protein [Actibacterium lipolyticum]|uniref:pectinesterase family protein n=1 Tax=Actibacterium lipolyticum TaxID=1524263 RepID=UPI001595E4F6|nr:pectinesterase family protein [Actibacterium lipolyticum]
MDQALVDASSSGSKRRRFIRVCPGTYDGPVYIPRSAPPLTFQGAGAAAVRVKAPIDAQMPGEEYQRRFGGAFLHAHPHVKAIFERIAAQGVISTGNSAVMRIESDDTVISGLTVENTYGCDRVAAAPDGEPLDVNGRYARGQHQAVALHVAGADRVHLHALQLSSFQDTLYLQSPAPFSTARTYLSDCKIEGDVDFIFGQATGFFENCEIKSRGVRGAISWATAPSTNIRTRYGFVFDGCRFTHDGHGTANCYLGRQWFEGVRATPYKAEAGTGMTCAPGKVSRLDGQSGEISRATLEAVGKCAVIGSVIGPHISQQCAWTDWNGGLPNPDGVTPPFAWNPRYRPVQHGSGDFFQYLGEWLENYGLDYSDIPADILWLGTFNTTFLLA